MLTNFAAAIVVSTGAFIGMHVAETIVCKTKKQIKKVKRIVKEMKEEA